MSDSKTGLLIFLTAFFLYSVVSPGNLPSDTEDRWSIARQIVRGQGVSLEDTHQTNSFTTSITRKRYSFYGLGQSICMIPFAALSLAIEKTSLTSPYLSDLIGQFLASSILFPTIGALLVWIFYLVLLSLGYGPAVSIFTSLVFGFSTMIFHYSVCTQEQSQIALLLTLAILFMVRYHRRQSFIDAWLFCVALGACLIFRPTSIVMIYPLYLIVVAIEVFKQEKNGALGIITKWFYAGVCGIVPFVIFYGWYNLVRFDDIFETGLGLSIRTTWGGPVFENRSLSTLSAMFFSPGKSIILYNPILLLLPVAMYTFYRRHKAVALAIAAAIIGNFAFYSFHVPWAGDYAWSIRYQVPILPFLILPLVVLFNGTLKSLAKTLVILLIIVSTIIQLSSVVYNFNLEFVQNPSHNIVPDEWVWDWSQSHLLKRFENIAHHMTNKAQSNIAKPASQKNLMLKDSSMGEITAASEYELNFFPFRARGKLQSPKLFYILLTIWLVELAAFCLIAFKLTQVYYRLKSLPQSRIAEK